MSNKNSGSFIGGLVIGTVIGIVTGLLIAPRKGRETRQLIKKSANALPEIAEDITSSVQLQAEKLSESALRQWEKTLDTMQQAIAAGIEATKKEQEALIKAETDTSSEIISVDVKAESKTIG